MALGKTNFPPGGVDTSDATAVAADILDTKTAYGSAGTKITGTMPNKVSSATVFTPGTSDQAITQGYYGGASGDGKVLGDADLVAGNIKSGVVIFGVTGTYNPDPTFDSVADFTDGTVTIKYRKHGKLYVFGDGLISSVFQGWVRSDSNTRSRIASVLGITISDYFESANSNTNSRVYYDGSNWLNNASSQKNLFAILAS